MRNHAFNISSHVDMQLMYCLVTPLSAIKPSFEAKIDLRYCFTSPFGVVKPSFKVLTNEKFGLQHLSLCRNMVDMKSYFKTPLGAIKTPFMVTAYMKPCLQVAMHQM